jgi:hypothetical protein
MFWPFRALALRLAAIVPVCPAPRLPLVRPNGVRLGQGTVGIACGRSLGASRGGGDYVGVEIVRVCVCAVHQNRRWCEM